MGLQIIILVCVFLATFGFSAIALTAFFRRREESRHAAPAGLAAVDEFQGPLVRRYFDVTLADRNRHSTANRLIRAGYFTRGAAVLFQLVRAILAVTIMLLVAGVMAEGWPQSGRWPTVLGGMAGGAGTFVLASVWLERQAKARQAEFRRLFPDFLDMMIVCLDAGMTIEAAAARVTREFVSRRMMFGLHLSIMMLEVKAGRRLREALANFAERTSLEEARSLSVLFRQSEELGTPVTAAMRNYAVEMRARRQIRAEELANGLPVKMLLPLGAFLFPVSLIIVLTPVLIRVSGILTMLKPPG